MRDPVTNPVPSVVPLKLWSIQKINHGVFLFLAGEDWCVLPTCWRKKMIYENFILKQNSTNSVWKTNAKHGSFIKMFKAKYFQTVVLKRKYSKCSLKSKYCVEVCVCVVEWDIFINIGGVCGFFWLVFQPSPFLRQCNAGTLLKTEIWHFTHWRTSCVCPPASTKGCFLLVCTLLKDKPGKER